MKINKPKISYLEDKDLLEQYKLEEYNNCRFTSNIDKDVPGTAEYVNKAIEFYYRKNN